MNIINRIGHYRRNGTWYQRSVGEIRKIVVHHSAVAHNLNNTDDEALNRIANIHYNNGWPGLAYHFVIPKSGTIYQTNNYSDITWTDGINKPSLSILVDGYFHPDVNDQPTIAQLESLEKLLEKLCYDSPEFPAGQGDVVAHREHSHAPTACCGNNLYPYVVKYRDERKILDRTVIDATPVHNNNTQNMPTYLTDEDYNTLANLQDEDGNYTFRGNVEELKRIGGHAAIVRSLDYRDRVVDLNNTKNQLAKTQSDYADLAKDYKEFLEEDLPSKYITVQEHQKIIDNMTSKQPVPVQQPTQEIQNKPKKGLFGWIVPLNIKIGDENGRPFGISKKLITVFVPLLLPALTQYVSPELANNILYIVLQFQTELLAALTLFGVQDVLKIVMEFLEKRKNNM